MSHARWEAKSLGALTLGTVLSLSSLSAAQQPPGMEPTPPAPEAPAPKSTSPEAVKLDDEADDSAAEKASSKPEAKDTREDAKDSDASPAAPTTKPSPAMLFLESRRQASQKPVVEAPPPDDGLMGTHQTHFHLNAGLRVSYLSNEGFDLFSKNDELTQISLAFGRTVLAMGETSFDASVLYDWGPSTATARGAKTSLDVHRVSLGLEGRYHLLRRLYLFARLAPGAVRWDADIVDGGADVTREAGDWAFSADLGAGAAVELIGEQRGQSKQPRGFLLADGGYGWTTSSTLELVPGEGASAPARLQPLELGELAFRGGYFRVALAITY